MAKLRVLVVDDSLTVRKRIVEILNADPDLEVIGEAEDGKAAIALCQSMRPDVITLDMMLPVMSGLAATEYIMAHVPTPILVVSASTNRGELFRTYDALAAGAVDVLEKPTGGELGDSWDRTLVSAVKLVARIRVITHVRAKLRSVSAHADTGPLGSGSPCQLLAVGASTGGPAAIVEILRGLRAGFPLPVLLVIHIGEPFAAAFADWLDGLSPVRVRYAVDGDPVPRLGSSGIVMARPDYHLVVERGRLRLTRTAERHSCRPSVDVLFESLAGELGRSCAACLLTGMGRDGAAGMLQIRRAGGITFAQDEETSVVFGMPREAARLGAAERVLPLSAMASAFNALATGEWCR
jgi:two-component system chemotaxis response regulator CheB